MAVSISLARAGGAGGSQSAVRERTARRWAQLLRERLGTADGAAQLLRGRLGIADGGGAAPQRFVVRRMVSKLGVTSVNTPPARTTAVAVPLVRRFSLAPRAAAGLRLIRPLGLRQTAQPRCELTPQPPTSACAQAAAKGARSRRRSQGACTALTQNEIKLYFVPATPRDMSSSLKGLLHPAQGARDHDVPGM